MESPQNPQNPQNPERSFDGACIALAKAAEQGYDAYDLCVAQEIGEAIDRQMKALGRRAKAKDRLAEDAGRLFLIACSTVEKSAGACTPRDAAAGVVDAYMNMGMDLGKVEKFTCTSGFAALSPFMVRD